MGVDALLTDPHRSIFHPGHRLAVPHLHAKTTQGLPSGRAQVFRERREDGWARFDQDDARNRRIDIVEFRTQRLPRNLAKGAGHFDAGGSAANQHVCQQPPLVDGIRLALRLFECDQQPPPDRQRIVQRLEARGGRRPLVVAKIRVRGTRSHDQVVVAEGVAAVQRDGLRGRVDVFDRRQQHPQPRLLSQDPPDRRGNVTRRQPGRRHLIQQRLEDVVIEPIDQRHLAGHVLKAARRRKARKPAADDDDLGEDRHVLYSKVHAKASRCAA